MLSAQDVHTVGPDTDAASKWLKASKWKCLIEDALPGATNVHSSGEVAILVRDYVGFGFRRLARGQFAMVPGRLIAAVVEAPGTKEFTVYSQYLYAGERLSKRNLEILSALGEHATAQGRPWLCGGDCQVSPNVVHGSDVLQMAGATVLHTDLSLGTCF